MNKHRSRKPRRSWLVGFAAVALVLLTLTIPVSESPAAVQSNPPEPYTVEWAYDKRGTEGGWVLEDPNCKCPEERPDLGEVDSWNWPTRCSEQNTWTLGSPYRPKNDWGGDDGDYPDHKYPAGFPDTFTGQAGEEIPFPGWPAVSVRTSRNAREGVSRWNGTRRKQYKDDYEEVAEPPGKTQPLEWGGVLAGKGGLGWENWQIHHILERKHNGTDHPGNLAPVYSLASRRTPTESTLENLNQHNDYTRWWGRIRTDGDLRPRPGVAPKDTKGPKKDTWKKIKSCTVVQWAGPQPAQ